MADLGESRLDRFLFEPFESGLDLLVWLEMTIGPLMLATATLKLVLVGFVGSKLAAPLLGEPSSSKVHDFLPRILLTGLASTVTVLARRTSGDSVEICKDGIFLETTSHWRALPQPSRSI